MHDVKFAKKGHSSSLRKPSWFRSEISSDDSAKLNIGDWDFVVWAVPLDCVLHAAHLCFFQLSIGFYRFPWMFFRDLCALRSLSQGLLYWLDPFLSALESFSFSMFDTATLMVFSYLASCKVFLDIPTTYIVATLSKVFSDILIRVEPFFRCPLCFPESYFSSHYWNCKTLMNGNDNCVYPLSVSQKSLVMFAERNFGTTFKHRRARRSLVSSIISLFANA
jgi:hypothetical protein